MYGNGKQIGCIQYKCFIPDTSFFAWPYMVPWGDLIKGEAHLFTNVGKGGVHLFMWNLAYMTSLFQVNQVQNLNNSLKLAHQILPWTNLFIMGKIIPKALLNWMNTECSTSAKMMADLYIQHEVGRSVKGWGRKTSYTGVMLSMFFCWFK